MIKNVILILAVLIADQLSKWWVLEQVFKPLFSAPSRNLIDWFSSTLRLPYISTEILPFFNLTMVWNEGIGLGLFGGSGAYVLSAVSIIVCAFLVYWMIKHKHDCLLQFSCALMIGGALGNVIDRLRFGAVADFLDFHAFGWHYPVFNIADCAIVISVFLLLIQPLFKGKV